MANDQVSKKDFEMLKKQLEALRERHNDLEKQVKVVGDNAKAAINGVNGMLPRVQYDSNWAALMDRLKAIEAAIKK